MAAKVNVKPSRPIPRVKNVTPKGKGVKIKK